MFSKTIIIAAAAILLGVNAQSAQVCGDANLNGRCESIPGDNSCKTIRKDWASSYRTNGLTCTFYDSDNCFNKIIGPVNGEDGNLRNGRFNDQINSIQCRK